MNRMVKKIAALVAVGTMLCGLVVAANPAKVYAGSSCEASKTPEQKAYEAAAQVEVEKFVARMYNDPALVGQVYSIQLPYGVFDPLGQLTQYILIADYLTLQYQNDFLNSFNAQQQETQKAYDAMMANLNAYAVR